MKIEMVVIVVPAVPACSLVALSCMEVPARLALLRGEEVKLPILWLALFCP